MQKNTREGLEIKFESNSTSSNLVICVGQKEEVLGYHIEMIASNKIAHILNFNLIQKDLKLNFLYDITSKLALSEFLKRTKVSRDKFLTMLWKISKTLLECNSYLLLDKCFLLDEEYIYIDPVSMELFMVYVPISVDLDINNEFREFATKLILHSINFDNSSDNYLQKALFYLKSEPFNILEFNKAITVMKADKDNTASKGIEKEDSEGLISRTEKVEVKNKKVLDESSKPLDFNNKITMLSLLSQVPIILLSIIVLYYFRVSGQETALNFIALAMIVIGLDALLLKYIFKKNKSEKKEVDVNKHVTQKALDIPEPKEKVITIKSTNVAMPKNKYDTVLLGHSGERHPFLKGGKGGNFEIIEISKPDFLIGRLQDQVDFVSLNNSIGKVHAQIITRDNHHYIKDMNSRNGTYINEERIDGSTEYEIKNNDNIRLANSEYTFIIPTK